MRYRIKAVYPNRYAFNPWHWSWEKWSFDTWCDEMERLGYGDMI